MFIRKSDDEFIKTVMEKEIPLVVINRHIDTNLIVNIMSNDTQGVYEAVEYFYKK